MDKNVYIFCLVNLVPQRCVRWNCKNASFWVASTSVRPIGMVKTSRTLFSLFPRRRKAKIHYYQPPPSKYLLLPSPINNLTPNPNSHWARNVKCPFCGGETKTMQMINIGATETFLSIGSGSSKLLLLLFQSSPSSPSKPSVSVS